MRVYNYRRLDVIVPGDVIEAFSFDNGLLNTAAEFIKINRNYHG